MVTGCHCHVGHVRAIRLRYPEGELVWQWHRSPLLARPRAGLFFDRRFMCVQLSVCLLRRARVLVSFVSSRVVRIVGICRLRCVAAFGCNVACYSPWVPAGSSSKRPVRCGQCIGCRLEYSRQWAVRIMHEAALHENNVFVTLTYKEAPNSLEYGDFQRFMRRLRKERGYARFFACGEYGEEGGRPHFHAVLFGVRFDDGEYLGKSGSGSKLYRSVALSELWPHGYASYGSVTFESAAYVARYVVKKVTGDGADAHYAGRVPEFARMSLRPGIGARWLEKYWSDVFPEGKVVSRDHVSNAPRYYRKKFAERFPDLARVRSDEQMEEIQKRVEEDAPGRLKAKEAVTVARLGMLKRKI